jgi:hypothetical protein
VKSVSEFKFFGHSPAFAGDPERVASGGNDSL